MVGCPIGAVRPDDNQQHMDLYDEPQYRGVDKAAHRHGKTSFHRQQLNPDWGPKCDQNSLVVFETRLEAGRLRGFYAGAGQKIAPGRN